MWIERFLSGKYNELAGERRLMHREDLIEKLRKYRTDDEVEEPDRVKIIKFVEKYKNCFERSQSLGHITGSCWLENYDGTKFLLTKHKKLKFWLQLGGHADGDNDIIRVSMKEAHEESGLKNIELVSSEIFDLGVHLIPQYKNVPSHYHYDIRFLLRASNSNENIIISDESTDLAWFTEIPKDNPGEVNRDMIRMIRKWKNFRRS